MGSEGFGSEGLGLNRRLTVKLSHRLRDFALDLEFSVGRETVALLGPSGAGKTTTLLAVAGVFRPDKGWIELSARRLLDTGSGVNLPPEEREIGLVPQDYALFPHLDVFENVAFGLRCRRRPEAEIKDKVNRALDGFGLTRLASARPARLSGGEQQRVALARALVIEPDALLLDEPMGALDVSTRRQVRDELARVLSELAIPALLVTHDPEDARVLATRELRIEGGRLTA